MLLFGVALISIAAPRWRARLRVSPCELRVLRGCIFLGRRRAGGL